MKNRKTLAFGGVIAIATLAALFFALGSETGSADVVLKEVPPEALERATFDLRVPDASDRDPSISAEEAIEIAQSERGGELEIREAVLATLSASSPRLDRQVVWVVNVKPTQENTVPPLGLLNPSATGVFWGPALAFLIFVDAQTGETLSSWQIASPDSTPVPLPSVEPGEPTWGATKQ